MAPPTAASASQPLSVRVQTLVQHPQFAWWVGHVVLLISAIRYGFSVISFTTASSQFYYRTAFVGAVLTYGVVIYKTHSAKVQQQSADKAVLMRVYMDENVQYLAMALFFLFTKSRFLALLPYATFSLFHTLTYLSSNVIPTFSPSSSPSGITAQINSFCKTNYEPAMRLVSRIEVIVLTPTFIYPLLTFKLKAVLQLGIWLHFIRYRYFTSAYTRQTFTHLSLRMDHFLANQNIPPIARQVWAIVKNTVQTYGATPIMSQPSGTSAAPQPNKSQ